MQGTLLVFGGALLIANMPMLIMVSEAQAEANCTLRLGVLHVVLVELGPASTAFVCNVSEKGDRIHRCMHCSLRKDLRCMHILFERR